MAFYSYVFTANIKGYKEKLHAIADREGLSYHKLWIDTIHCVLKYGMALSDYLNYEFWKKSKKERRSYAGVRLQNDFYEKVSPAKYKKRYTVKPDFQTEFIEFTKRKFVVPEREDLDKVNEFIDSHEEFILKPVEDWGGGKDVSKVKCAEIEDRQKFYDDCVTNHLFLEEVITQHEEMNRLCPTSCNTIRIMTFNNKGKAEVLDAYLRVGNGENVVDNFHAGGTVTPIDTKTGKLVGNALDKDLKEFEYHPMTGVKFDGFQIPYYKEVVEMVKKAALMGDKILVIGWDVTIAPDGPVIIEANRRPGFDGVQVASKRGRKDLMRHCLRELGMLKK